MYIIKNAHTFFRFEVTKEWSGYMNVIYIVPLVLRIRTHVPSLLTC